MLAVDGRVTNVDVFNEGMSKDFDVTLDSSTNVNVEWNAVVTVGNSAGVGKTVGNTILFVGCSTSEIIAANEVVDWDSVVSCLNLVEDSRLDGCIVALRLIKDMVLSFTNLVEVRFTVSLISGI